MLYSYINIDKICNVTKEVNPKVISSYRIDEFEEDAVNITIVVMEDTVEIDKEQIVSKLRGCLSDYFCPRNVKVSIVLEIEKM